MGTTLEALLSERPVFVNVGVRAFGESLSKTGYDVVQVDWSPPAGGNVEMASLLDDLL